MLTFFYFYVSPQDCESPPVIAHGQSKIVSKLFAFEHQAVYECDEGYILVGAKELSCTSSGWSPAVPQCKGNSGSLFILGGQGWGLSSKGWEHSFFPVRGSKKTIWFDLLKIITMVWWYPKQKVQRAHRTLISLSFPRYKIQPLLGNSISQFLV